MKLKIRCPACAKLYEVAEADIRTDMPLFRCVSCESFFSFDYPPIHGDSVSCFLVNQGQAELSASSKPSANAQQQAKQKPCPKCGAINLDHSKECFSCHVLFDQLEGLPTDKSLNAQPSLVKKWRNLIENFEDDKLHDEFILACHQLDALRFAVMKYEELKIAQGGDAKCDMMLVRIQSMMFVSLSQSPLTPEVKSVRAKWRKYLFWGPFALSGLLIILGISNLAHRNLIGAGVALAFMSAGLIVMVKGQLSVTDFLD